MFGSAVGWLCTSESVRHTALLGKSKVLFGASVSSHLWLAVFIIAAVIQPNQAKARTISIAVGCLSHSNCCHRYMVHITELIPIAKGGWTIKPVL